MIRECSEGAWTDFFSAGRMARAPRQICRFNAEKRHLVRKLMHFTLKNSKKGLKYPEKNIILVQTIVKTIGNSLKKGLSDGLRDRTAFSYFT